MSETGAGGTVNNVGARKLGTVGRPLPGIQLKLAEDNEVLVRRPSGIVGYRGQDG
jgi:long-subunit acyl-CoA synthetase (AMP-forming)